MAAAFGAPAICFMRMLHINKPHGREDAARTMKALTPNMTDYIRHVLYATCHIFLPAPTIPDGFDKRRGA
jgi:hypothetical protein